MSKFTDNRDAVENFVSKGWHSIWHGLQPAIAAATPEVETALINVAKGAAAAALQAQATAPDGADMSSVVGKAALSGAIAAGKAQEAPLLSAGITITGEQLGSLAGLMTAHVTQDAPPPPVKGG